jgi:hypothetical protein
VNASQERTSVPRDGALRLCLDVLKESEIDLCAALGDACYELESRVLRIDKLREDLRTNRAERLQLRLEQRVRLDQRREVLG